MTQADSVYITPPTNTSANDDPPLHKPHLFLSTRIVQAGCDMIETIGELKGKAAGDDFDAQSWAMDRLRDAVGRASAALANYDRAIAEGRSLMTFAEYDGRAQS
jgi:hypothetical protein